MQQNYPSWKETEQSSVMNTTTGMHNHWNSSMKDARRTSHSKPSGHKRSKEHRHSTRTPARKRTIRKVLNTAITNGQWFTNNSQ